MEIYLLKFFKLPKSARSACEIVLLQPLHKKSWWFSPLCPLLLCFLSEENYIHLSSWVSVTASRRISLDGWANHLLPSDLALCRKKDLFSTCSFSGHRPEGRGWRRWVIPATGRIICAIATHSLVAIITGGYLRIFGFYPILCLSKG